MPTIYEHALTYLKPGDVVGLGSGHAAYAFIKLLGERVRAGLAIKAVSTSQASTELAERAGIPLISLPEGPPLEDALGSPSDEVAENVADRWRVGAPIAVTVDGADEVDGDLNMIKGYGRSLLREKVVALSSQKLIILIGPGKEVETLGQRGKLPVEVTPFAVPLALRLLRDLGCDPVLWMDGDRPALTDNGNHILDCGIGTLEDPHMAEEQLLMVPGVVGTGLFLGLADVVLVGDDDFNLVGEKTRE
jgi:ribose 5-phosphate isomerase A